MFSKLFNSKKQEEQTEARIEELKKEFSAKLEDLMSDYQQAISANNSMLQQIKAFNNDVNGKNVLKAHKENREKINEFIDVAINANCEKHGEIQRKYQ